MALAATCLAVELSLALAELQKDHTIKRITYGKEVDCENIDPRVHISTEARIYYICGK